MELLCPHCQQKLMIADEHAGQVIACPLCKGQFQAPAMPGFATPPTPQPPSPSPAPQAPDHFTPEQPRTPSPEQPFTEDFPPPPPSSGFASTQAPSTPKQGGFSTQPPTPPPSPKPTGEYANRAGFSVDVAILRWVPAGSMFLIFILSFFTWVHFTPMGVPYHSQNGWQAAFASVSKSKDMKTLIKKKESSEEETNGRSRGGDPITQYLGDPNNLDKDLKPGVSVPSICYLLMLVLFLIPVTAGVPVLELFANKLPQNLQPILNFRWTIVTGLVLAVWFLLLLQLMFGFALESNYRKFVNEKYDIGMTEFEKKAKDAPDEVADQVSAGRRVFRQVKDYALKFTDQTWVVTWVVILHTLTIVIAAYLMWLDLRKKPDPPRVEVLW